MKHLCAILIGNVTFEDCGVPKKSHTFLEFEKHIYQKLSSF